MAEGRSLRRIGDPVVAAAPAGVRIRTRIHVSDPEAAALAVIGGLLGSVYRCELVERIRLGRLDRGLPNAASGSRPPRTPWLNDPAWSSFSSAWQVSANFMMLHEHYLDFSYAPTLHASEMPPGVDRDQHRVHCLQTLRPASVIDIRHGAAYNSRLVVSHIDLMRSSSSEIGCQTGKQM